MTNGKGVVEINRLVKKAQKGDDRAFIKLFQRYEADIYRMAYVYVKNESDALDVVQEVAYRAFKKIETLKDPDYFKTWLIKITIKHPQRAIAWIIIDQLTSCYYHALSLYLCLNT